MKIITDCLSCSFNTCIQLFFQQSMISAAELNVWISVEEMGHLNKFMVVQLCPWHLNWEIYIILNKQINSKDNILNKRINRCIRVWRPERKYRPRRIASPYLEWLWIVGFWRNIARLSRGQCLGEWGCSSPLPFWWWWLLRERQCACWSWNPRSSWFPKPFLPRWRWRRWGNGNRRAPFWICIRRWLRWSCCGWFLWLCLKERFSSSFEATFWIWVLACCSSWCSPFSSRRGCGWSSWWACRVGPWRWLFWLWLGRQLHLGFRVLAQRRWTSWLLLWMVGNKYYN